jgi:hypothetical protein
VYSGIIVGGLLHIVHGRVQTPQYAQLASGQAHRGQREEKPIVNCRWCYHKAKVLLLLVPNLIAAGFQILAYIFAD